ncbi:phage protein NinX family protein [Morganella morganii]|uniref:phage protein NinX family protein n=1 Tax=Morganella morganii TaxID=582 RepID=UPI000F62FB3A|nr:phage protein NinX family protein [Morganella morganii]EKW8498950.1 DUF2591 family protein [Morganella morganii]MBT0454805.1 DUF2591 family protein [Morganella morganii subsp. morganii]MBT0488701.1 DUF2591 family protein [Morganella morganii subsp. morganii]MBT0502567.1 DUF2591 family protein [Morganella morganii subsp. morganii]QWM13308.1 DUF2591 family protein [Morganella morganii subsp. morganii]
MNKYSDKSDYEINKAVAECKYGIGCTGKTQGGDVIVFTDSFTAVFDPCNNPTDAMPIVIENRISIESRFNGHYDEWYASLQTNKILIDATGTNYYRIAMEAFLMMKDADNEKI